MNLLFDLNAIYTIDIKNKWQLRTAEPARKRRIRFEKPEKGRREKTKPLSKTSSLLTSSKAALVMPKIKKKKHNPSKGKGNL